MILWLVVGTHLKNISEIGSFPQVGLKIKNIWNHHPVLFWISKIPPPPFFFGVSETPEIHPSAPPAVQHVDSAGWPIAEHLPSPPGIFRECFQIPKTPGGDFFSNKTKPQHICHKNHSREGVLYSDPQKMMTTPHLHQVGGLIPPKKKRHLGENPRGLGVVDVFVQVTVKLCNG